MSDVVQQLVNALSLGSIYALVALGLAVVFSVLGLVNFAHAQLITLAGYAMWGLSGETVWIALLAGGVVASALGALALERLVFVRLRSASLAAMLLASVAVGIILQTAFQILFGAEPKRIDYPAWTGETVNALGVRVQLLDLVTIVTTGLLLAALLLFLRRTVMGVALRAAAEDFSMARLMGVRAGAVVAAAFAVSGVLAGVAAFFWFASSGIVQPDGGTVPLLKGFIAVVIGGLGSLSGAVIAGFGLGALETLIQAYAPGSVTPYTDTLVFAVLLIVVVLRPMGLVASKSRAA
ncbi:MAG: branched-chain amino acid transport system permease protein [Thermoleophilaceae bacterium]|nr:branched-chain amino acid transport system permease protein [Thermoleophilaceae bacterium]